jgi:hypothetical protein
VMWVQQPEHEATMRKLYAQRGGRPDEVPKVYYGYDRAGREVLHALVSREEIVPGDSRWHISLSAEKRLPRWNELAEAVHDLRPGVPFCIGIPPKSWWINVHEFVLHAYEIKDDNLVGQWRFEGRGDTPT